MYDRHRQKYDSSVSSHHGFLWYAKFSAFVNDSLGNIFQTVAERISYYIDILFYITSLNFNTNNVFKITVLVYKSDNSILHTCGIKVGVMSYISIE